MVTLESIRASLKRDDAKVLALIVRAAPNVYGMSAVVIESRFTDGQETVTREQSDIGFEKIGLFASLRRAADLEIRIQGIYFDFGNHPLT